ncbi:hypothetical protein STA3757_09510 [Stanieria sp. NIES-3757]|nr:hypothetical protein STA3757_09510 [Stanieria sp. NIES-3757]
MSERLIDLDELVLRCQDQTTKDYIQEAVSCYRAGAFRSCIVSTWNAVVFDFLHKLRQLEITGDNQARDELKKFESLRSKDDKRNLWQFEIDIPKLAQEKYEFISSIERQNLERLNQDRSLCAHPSMQSVEEPFQATPELARYHLRNAIIDFLQHPPVQGKAALDRIWDTIKSEYFPRDNIEQAIQILSSSLARARKSLIKSVVIGLTKSLLHDNKPVEEQARMYTALEAVSKLHFREVEEVINNHLSKIIESVPDQNWKKVFVYLRRMKAWESLDRGQQIKAKNCIEQIDELDQENSLILLNALGTSAIKGLALEKINKFDDENLTPLIKLIFEYQDKIKPENITSILERYIPYVIEKFTKSGSFYTSKVYGEQLLWLAKYLTIEQIKTILNVFCENGQIYGADKEIPEIMINFFQKTIQLVNPVKEEWLLVRQTIEHRRNYSTLRKLIDEKFPDSSELDSNEFSILNIDSDSQKLN